MKSKIILAGKGGSGKDYLRKLLEEKLDLTYSISHTSRPIREGEEEGVDYYFTDRDFFQNNASLFYEFVEFNGWYYGTSVIGFEKADLLIMTPSGIEKLKSADREISFIVYIDIPYETRKERLEARNDADSSERRLKTDEDDFKDFQEYDLVISNPSFGDFEIMQIIDHSAFYYYLKHFKNKK